MSLSFNLERKCRLLHNESLGLSYSVTKRTIKLFNSVWTDLPLADWSPMKTGNASLQRRGAFGESTVKLQASKKLPESLCAISICSSCQVTRLNPRSI